MLHPVLVYIILCQLICIILEHGFVLRHKLFYIYLCEMLQRTTLFKIWTANVQSHHICKKKFA